MAEMVFFTDNYQDHSTREGWQFEFFCRRCGNGYASYAAQVNQLNEKIQQQDLTGNVNYRDQGTGLCANCGQETGGGKFCKSCGQPQASAQSAQKFCGNCGSQLTGAKFCGECGTPGG